MKLVTFRDAGGDHIGAVLDDGTTLLDFGATGAMARYPTMQSLMDDSQRGLEAAASAIRNASQARLRRLDGVALLAPVPVPVQMRDTLSFEKHFAQARAASARLRVAQSGDREALAQFDRLGPPPIPKVWYEQPIYYKQNRFSVVGPDADVEWPAYSRKMDYELEFAVFLGRKVKDATPAEAGAAIFGYTIFNDFSARDAQSIEMVGMLGPAKGKDFDTGNAIGPWLVTADEVADPYALSMTASVNGEIRSRGSTSSMHHRFPQIIAFISQSETLYPGEFIGSGTVGDGCGHECGRYLNPGDVVELAVDGLGSLRNRIIVPSKAERTKP